MIWLVDSWAFLSLGFVIGMAHALEADHLAVDSAILSGKASRRSLMARGAVWGLGIRWRCLDYARSWCWVG